MTHDEYIERYPYKFDDELDKWLFKEFNIVAGACSSIRSAEYSLAREVAQKAMEYAKQKILKDAVEGVVTDERAYESYEIDEIDITVDYDKDTTPFFVGDKVRIYVFKEE